MDTPALVLLPSPPLQQAPSQASSLLPQDNSPGTSDSSHSRARPPSSYNNLEEPERNSSETTIFTIYSMYSERRATWGDSVQRSTHKESQNDLNGSKMLETSVTDEGRLGNLNRDSFFRAPVSRQTSSGSTYHTTCDTPPDDPSRIQSYAPDQSQPTSKSSALSDYNSGIDLTRDSTELAYADRDSFPSIQDNSSQEQMSAADEQRAFVPSARSRSSQAVSSWSKYVDLRLSDDIQPDLSLNRFSSNYGKMYSSSRATTEESDDTGERPPRPPRNSPPSGHTVKISNSQVIDCETSALGTPGVAHDHIATTLDVSSRQASRSATPVPPPPPPKSPRPTTPRESRISNIPVTPPSPTPTSDRKSTVSFTPQTNSISPKFTASPGLSSISSSLSSSNAPAAGEDPEAFFVRITYARLDASGVRGDGYEEGIERTRAKLGHDRRSVQMAAQNEARSENEERVISQKEMDMLKGLDRYGFSAVPSHDRLILLPSATLLKPLHPARVNTSSAPSPPHLPSLPAPRQSSKEKEMARIAKWGRMLEAERRDQGGNVSIWRMRTSKERKLRERVFKGVPDRWRAAAWEVLVGRWVDQHQKRVPARGDLDLENLRREYRVCLDKPSSYDVQIDLDVPRTINGHVLFKTRYGLGQRSLFHVLHSLSLHCSECGYCQGMGPLAATLLCYYEPEKVYAMLVHLHDSYLMHTIFAPGFPGLLESIYVQERIMERMLPGVFAAFKKHMISTTSYATKWYITLFANSVPFQTQLRLWDAFFLEGRDVFVITAVAIVWVLKDHLTSSQATFESVLSLLSSFFVPEEEDALLKWIARTLSDKALRGDMARWRDEWQGLVAKRNEAGVLL